MCTTDVIEAIELIHVQTFDLFILEYCLPLIMGPELCEKIQALGAKTPIIIYSLLSRNVDLETAFFAGANAYLVKPDEFDKLPLVIDGLLHPAPAILPRHPPARRVASIISITKWAGLCRPEIFEVGGLIVDLQLYRGSDKNAYKIDVAVGVRSVFASAVKSIGITQFIALAQTSAVFTQRE